MTSNTRLREPPARAAWRSGFLRLPRRSGAGGALLLAETGDLRRMTEYHLGEFLSKAYFRNSINKSMHNPS